jgi:ubiquinone/menaquinone biosynthesis C-methylase UbiE
MRYHLFSVGVVLLLGGFVTAAAPKYEYRKEHDPDGIGKFYMGREIAWVMGHQAADWLERPKRVEEERTDKLLKILPLKAGMVVADVGAGSGYFTFPMARKVGLKGTVYAVDVQKEMLAIIQRKRSTRLRFAVPMGVRYMIDVPKVLNVEPVLGTITDPKLPAGKVDLILMVDVYHEFSHPYEMTEAMTKALKPGGQLVFVEYRLEDEKVPIKLVHKMSEKQVKKEMAIHPQMKHAKTVGTLPWQHVIIFEKKGK